MRSSRESKRSASGSGLTSSRPFLELDPARVGPPRQAASIRGAGRLGVPAPQILDEEVPETDHNFRVGLIVTPARTIAASAARRPPGIIWEHLDREKVDAVPVLRELARARGHG